MPNQARYHGICKYNENTTSVVNVVSKAISKWTCTLYPARQFFWAALKNIITLLDW